MVDDSEAMQDIWKQLPDWLKNLNARSRTIWSEIHEDIVPQDYFKTEKETSFFHKDGICYMVERSSLYQLYSKIRFGKKTAILEVSLKKLMELKLAIQRVYFTNTLNELAAKAEPNVTSMLTSLVPVVGNALSTALDSSSGGDTVAKMNKFKEETLKILNEIDDIFLNKLNKPVGSWDVGPDEVIEGLGDEWALITEIGQITAVNCTDKILKLPEGVLSDPIREEKTFEPEDNYKVSKILVKSKGMDEKQHLTSVLQKYLLDNLKRSEKQEQQKSLEDVE
ncbi:hypothetical protein MCGE09_00334 [Thaumarchaeota archaeon SCGC AB-539-E09]|nr:hypothetical protein MCGE09_00334 [Thaumarchaeota archaeon SCGC AB-539-E09]